MRKFLLSSALIFCYCFQLQSQSFSPEDLELLQNQLSRPELNINYFKRPLALSGKTILSRYNPISVLAASSMYFYQNVISWQLNSNCPYEHSCSSFSNQCISEYGLFKGVFLSADRLTRCTSFGLRDINPKYDVNHNSHRCIDHIHYYE